MTDQTKIRVVVADDEPDVRLMLRYGLEVDELSVVAEAADGAEAIERLDETGADAIVLDLLMPGTNGFEAIPEIRRRFPLVGIVAYSAVAGDFVRSEMRRMEIPLVLKQSDTARLADAIRDACARRRALHGSDPET